MKRLCEFYEAGTSQNNILNILIIECEEALRKHEVGSSVCDHDWVRLGDPDRQACRCKKCGEYDG